MVEVLIYPLVSWVTLGKSLGFSECLRMFFQFFWAWSSSSSPLPPPHSLGSPAVGVGALPQPSGKESCLGQRP